MFEVASGRVIFAEWIRDYGMIQIIEHGNGSTGAVNDSGLYFEIRKDGKPLAVQGWF
jgi:septal ring factor EnvC (AmiA/AmiB activator)